MKRIIIFVVMALTLCAAVPDDDSVPYYPYPPQPQPEQTPEPKPTPKPAPAKKAPAKKPAPKKSTRKTPKKAPAKKSAPVRKSSLQTGIELLQQDRYEQAKPYLLKAIQENRNDPNVWYWYGVYHEKTGGFYQAQFFYSKAVTIDPAFEPLSRVVFYPDDPEKTPLWDPKRPARVYPVETASVPLNVSRIPNAPNDPEMPKVPVYTPPEPGADPLGGDEWNPVVYVPPAPEELQTFDGQTPVYNPPEAGAVLADESMIYREIRTYPDEPESGQIIENRDRIFFRVDKPLYNPPEPGQKVTPPPQQQQPQKKAIQAKPSTPDKRQSTVPASRVVRQSQKPAKKSTPAAKAPSKPTRKSQPQRRTVSRDVQPKQTQRRQTPAPTQPRQQQTPKPKPTPTPPPVVEPKPEQTQPARRESEYMPPVGQYAPDPGTISDKPIPPVGQR